MFSDIVVNINFKLISIAWHMVGIQLKSSES